MREQAEGLLKQAYGGSATFRPGQWEAIETLVHDGQRLLVVQPTGWGKSLVYFVATRLLRERGRGPTLLISPLLALMRNQREAAERLNLETRSITSENTEEWEDVIADLEHDRVDVLLVSPERLANQEFHQRVLPAIRRGIGLLVVDEAHCISDWGHDFRPDYRRIVRISQNLPPGTPVLGTTATATERVVSDIRDQLGPALAVQRGPLGRKSLRLQNMRLVSPAERLAWLVEAVPRLPGTGIIYCLTTSDTERVAAFLRDNGIDAEAYHSDLDKVVCRQLEDRLQANDLKVLVATVKLGMGYDKPDLRFVIHYQRPGSVVAYYQQVGRAGRDGSVAYGVLLSGVEDDQIADYFIDRAFPTEEAVRSVLAAIESNGSATLPEILGQVNLQVGRVAQVLKLLEIDRAIYVEKPKRGRVTYYRTPGGSFISNRPMQDAISERRRAEVRRMQEYVVHTECLMAFLARELDDPETGPCGQCACCTGPFMQIEPSPQLVEEALSYLKRLDQPLRIRKQWPDKSRIPAELQVAEGRALCQWGDPGWAELVKRGKYPPFGTGAGFADELVEAAAAMIEDRWRPYPPPAWVTCVPSLGRPTLVSSFAERLAARLRLPFASILAKVRPTAPQKEMENSVQQVANILDVFAVIGDVLPGPVLLVDDVVDSGWTLAICGMGLRQAGAEHVYSFALATQLKGSDDL